MDNIFDIPTVNDRLPTDIDQAWLDRINASFPTPYAMAEDVNTSSPQKSHPDFEQARLRNIEVGKALRHDMIKRVRLLDEAGAAQLVGGMSRLQEFRETGAVIAVLDHGAWLYPLFQFNPKTHFPYPVVARIEKFFKKEINQWGELSWWVSPNIHLNRRAPYEYLTPERELELMLFLDENRLRLS